MIKLIVGLGNPGTEYAHTRHNAGMWAAQILAERYQATFHFESKFQGCITSITVNGHSCKILLPTTFMNLSGQSVVSVALYYKIKPEEILVMHDELDLPVGCVKLKCKGGHGGHNGLRDIQAKLATDQFNRLRIGIGHPGNKSQVSDYVLHKPSENEQQTIIIRLEEIIESLLPSLIEGNIEQAMLKLHSQHPTF